MLRVSDPDLIAHWPFREDLKDHSESGLAIQNHGVEIGESGGQRSAQFNGAETFLEVPCDLSLGTGDFSCAGWIHTEETEVVGDILSQFDPETRQGWQVSVLTNTGMTSTAQSNYRNLHFGIDNGHLGAWKDCGRPGQAVKISALSTLGGHLYAGTFENGEEEVGHLWRYEGKKRWTDLGNPVGCNSVNAVVEFKGALYCALGRYNSSGSAMGDPLNTTPGGQVYRVDADGQWTFCGHPGIEDATPEEIPTTGHNTGKADNATALTVYQGRLYATSLYREGAFVYDGGTSWTPIGPDVRLMSFTVYRDRLYTLVNGGPVLRYEGGAEWTDCGCPETSTQTYSAVTFKGELYVGTWPQGEVYRYDGNKTWTCLDRVGYEREIMAMGLYNGKVYIGSLPMANVWRMDGNQFTFLASLDHTSAPLRRVWSMAVYQGRLYAGTLPSGHVYSVEAGKVATWDCTFPEGWRHIAAVKQGGVLTLYVDGTPVATTDSFNPKRYDLNPNCPLLIGFGTHDYFKGALRDVRIYRRGLTQGEIQNLARD